MARLETRVARIAEALLAERRSIRPIDVLVGLGWLAQPNVDRWERGRVPSLDRWVGVDTDYDTLLMSGVDRESARAQVHQRVEDVVNAWRDGVAMLDG